MKDYDAPKLIEVGGEPVDLMKCYNCCNFGVEGCPMGLFFQQKAAGERPTAFKRCTAFKLGG